MEKKTLLAVVLSILVLIVFYTIQGIFFPPVQATQTPQATSPAVESPSAATMPPAVTAAPTDTFAPVESTPYFPDTYAPVTPPPGAARAPDTEERVTVETELLRVVFSNAGGNAVSWKLKDHRDDDDFVEMVLAGSRETHAFTVAFGGLNAQPVTSFFHVNRISDHTVEFYRDFSVPGGGQFRMTKRYDFRPRDYMVELTITMDGGHTMTGFNFDGSAYTLAFGPQIGPRFEKLDGRYDFRRYHTFVNGKLREEKRINDTNPIIINTRPDWAAITGKYFTCIAIPAIPLLSQYELNFSERPEPGLVSASRMHIIRPPVYSPRIADTYRFYLGPKNQEILHTYSNGNNDFRISGLRLTDVASTGGILSPLENALKWLLVVFYRMVPNYGVAIILLTLLVKIVFFPLTKKSSEATLRMQSVAPKIKELQEKYKDNKQKLNTEMAELYKKEGYNPISGCLPMLLQLPIFFAMYRLFDSHFDLRHAMFIPGWIPDLSMPESIWSFPEGVRLPIFGWTALRLLPFLYVGSQLLYGKVTQTPDQQMNAQMKMMLYVMPVVFFFVLYDMPSGLLIYWIFSNLLTMVQQMAINKYLAPRRAAAAAAAARAAAASPPKTLPPSKKKKKNN